MAKWTAMWAGSVTVFVVFVVISQILLGEDREFLESGDEGFKMLYPQDLDLNEVHFFIDTTKTPTTISFFVVVDVENRDNYSLLALQIPYSGLIKEDSGWAWRPFEDSTLVVKEFRCSKEKSCSFLDNVHYFEFELDEPIDQKQSFRHSVRLWFSEENPLLEPEIPPLIKQFNPHRKPYHIGFDEIPEAKVTVIFDKSSDSFGPTPDAPIVPGPKPNTIQLDWHIDGGILHQIDYQLPSERNLETRLLYYTALFGIGLGITNLAIYGAEQRSKKVKADKMQELILDRYEKDAIDDSYHLETKSPSGEDSK
jgi:hypothetical protein